MYRQKVLVRKFQQQHCKMSATLSLSLPNLIVNLINHQNQKQKLLLLHPYHPQPQQEEAGLEPTKIKYSNLRVIFDLPKKE